MRRALVTGGAGFIGSHMTDRLLKEGYEVIVMDNESTGFRKNVPDKAQYIKGDVTKKNDISKAFEKRVDVVFHIAGKASTIRSFDDPYLDLSTNVIGTLNIIELCLKRKVPRFLYASSMTCYGHPDNIPTSIEDLCQPISYYGISKYSAERYVHATAGRNDFDFDFNVTSFRMFNVYGERQSLENPYQGVMAIFISNILNRKPITIHSDGEQSRDFIYVGDVVEAWVSSIDNPQTFGRVFNLGADTALSINQLVDLILNANNKKRSNYPIRYSEERPGDQRHMRADISETKSLLNWSPKKELKEGIMETIKWANKHWQNKNAHVK